MSADNLISIKINQKDLESVNQSVKNISNILSPHLVSLSPEMRMELPKMGDGTLPFVEKVLNYSKTNPEFVPPYVNIDEMEIDVEAIKTLNTVYRPLVQLMQQLSDSIMLSGSEAYVASLAYYNTSKLAAKNRVPGAEAIYDDLKKRFAKNGRDSADVTNEENLDAL